MGHIPLEHRTSTHAAFSPDGSRIVIASKQDARVFDVLSLKELAAIGHDQQVTWAAFSRDGKRLVSASLDKTARVWDVRWLTLHGGELVLATCREKLAGARVISADDVAAAPVLIGRQDQDVCAETSAVDRIRTWLTQAMR
jgi:WD40 repeat protein